MEQLVGDVFLAMELSLQYVLARKDMLRAAMWKLLLRFKRSGVRCRPQTSDKDACKPIIAA
jgi:hypothetical protein